jgi:hypothetical protein
MAAALALLSAALGSATERLTPPMVTSPPTALTTAAINGPTSCTWWTVTVTLSDAL